MSVFLNSKWALSPPLPPSIITVGSADEWLLLTCIITLVAVGAAVPIPTVPSTLKSEVEPVKCKEPVIPEFPFLCPVDLKVFKNELVWEFVINELVWLFTTYELVCDDNANEPVWLFTTNELVDEFWTNELVCEFSTKVLKLDICVEDDITLSPLTCKNPNESICVELETIPAPNNAIVSAVIELAP